MPFTPTLSFLFFAFPEPERFQAWFYSIVLNTARSFLKQRKQNPLSLENIMGGMSCKLLPFSDAIVDPQEVAEERELHRLLLGAVQALSPKERAFERDPRVHLALDTEFLA